MTNMNYIGLDVHKKTISYCVKDAAGQVLQEGKVGSTRRELDCWIKTLPQPRTIAMEATIFTGWIYDHLLPHAEEVKVAHPLMLRAIAAAKKKNDKIDAGKIADCLRCDFLPECHMVSTEIRDRRRTLRYRHLLVRQIVQMKNRVSGLPMETGVEHNKQRLHKVGYFHKLLSANQEVHPCIQPLLKISRDTIERYQKTEYALVSSLQRDPIPADRIKRLRTIPWSWANHCPDVGTGDRRCLAFPDHQAGHQLLRTLRRRKKLCRQGDANASFQTTQQAYPARAGGSCEAGAETVLRVGPGS
jgi:transposase